MGVPWVAVPIAQDAEALGPADPVLDCHPKAAEAAVVVLELPPVFLDSDLSDRRQAW